MCLHLFMSRVVSVQQSRSKSKEDALFFYQTA